jgi:hypothetical protein
MSKTANIHGLPGPHLTGGLFGQSSAFRLLLEVACRMYDLRLGFIATHSGGCVFDKVTIYFWREVKSVGRNDDATCMSSALWDCQWRAVEVSGVSKLWLVANSHVQEALQVFTDLTLVRSRPTCCICGVWNRFIVGGLLVWWVPSTWKMGYCLRTHRNFCVVFGNSGFFRTHNYFCSESCWPSFVVFFWVSAKRTQQCLLMCQDSFTICLCRVCRMWFRRKYEICASELSGGVNEFLCHRGSRAVHLVTFCTLGDAQPFYSTVLWVAQWEGLPGFSHTTNTCMRYRTKEHL